MASKHPDFSRIEALITEYTEKNGIDGNVNRMMKITENFRNSKRIGFFDLAFISGILGASPDYITGDSDTKEAEDTYLLRLLADAVRLNGDNLRALCRKSESYLDIQENLIDYDRAGITVKEYSSEGDLLSQTVPDDTSNMPRVADIKTKYKKDKK